MTRGRCHAAAISVAAVLIVGGLGWWWLHARTTSGTGATPPAAARGAGKPQADPTGPNQPAPLQAEQRFPVATTKQPVNVSEMVYLPDGTYVPTINNLKNPPPMRWPSDRAYSKIVSRRVDASGQEWFVHADGSHSSLTMMFRQDLGRDDPTWVFYNPAPAAPMVPESTGGAIPASGRSKN